MKKNSFVKLICATLVGIMALPPVSLAEHSFKKETPSYYQDMFDQNVYGSFTRQFDLPRWFRGKITKERIPAQNINIYDEVPDSTFFTNRQGRKLSAGELKQASTFGKKINAKKGVTILSAELIDIHPTFLVKDSDGKKYILTFDMLGYENLATSAEVMASRLYHALGYNVPRVDIVEINPDKIILDPQAEYRDSSGFLKELTEKDLKKLMIFLPKTKKGNYRVSARKVLEKESLGPFRFTGRRKNDPNDPVNRENRREIRALRVFSAWLNHTDLRESLGEDIVVEIDGEPTVKHFITGFRNAFGVYNFKGKPPMHGYEHLFDYSKTWDSFLALGFKEKLWEKVWKKAEEQKKVFSPKVGYLKDKAHPLGFKTDLPNEAFRRITRADRFWAGKLILSFDQAALEAIVKAGKHAKMSKRFVQYLKIRGRHMGKFLLFKTTPIDQISLNQSELSYKDLEVLYGFDKSTPEYDIVVKAGEKEIDRFSLNGEKLALKNIWFESSEKISIYFTKKDEKAERAWTRVDLNPSQILGIRHQD